jgi:lysophospholipase
MNVIAWFLTTFIIVGIHIPFMANASTFTQENQLQSRLPTKIADFWQTGTFSSFLGVDNKRINYASFITHQPENCLVISPGRSEGYLKYKELAYDLSQLNINIFIIDHRGQGLSERLLTNPHKGFVNKFDDYVDDLQTFIEKIVTPHCTNEERPLLLAHSMGGTIATRLMQKHPKSIKSAMLSSPMIAINSGGLPDWIAKTLIHSGNFINQLFEQQSWYFIGQNDYQAKSFEHNSLMQSPIRFQIFTNLYAQNPKLQLGGVTINWLKQAIKTQQDIFQDLDKIMTPITILQSGADTVVDNSAQNRFCQQLYQMNNLLCTQQKPYVIEGAKHELFFESDRYRNQALTFITQWISDSNN